MLRRHRLCSAALRLGDPAREQDVIHGMLRWGCFNSRIAEKNINKVAHAKGYVHVYARASSRIALPHSFDFCFAFFSFFSLIIRCNRLSLGFAHAVVCVAEQKKRN